MTNEEKHDEERSSYELFENSLSRARALIHLQYGIDFLLESEGDIINHFFEKEMPDSPYVDAFKVLMDNIKTSLSEPNKINSEEFTQMEDDFKEIATHIKEGDIEKVFEPVIHVFKAIELIHDNPLYHEAVVSSVTSFETYLKDTLITLIAHNDKIEHRFYDELKNGTSYDKIKEYDYNYHYILGYIVVEKVKFYNLDDVERILKKAFNKDDSFSFFDDTTEKIDLKNFFELRHIVVHNGGYVDHKFKKNTKCKHEVDEYFDVDKDNVLKMMDLMMKTANTIENEIKEGGYHIECHSDDILDDQ